MVDIIVGSGFEKNHFDNFDFNTIHFDNFNLNTVEFLTVDLLTSTLINLINTSISMTLITQTCIATFTVAKARLDFLF